MSKSDAFETAFLELVYNNQDIPNIGDAGGIRGSVADGELFLALHTANPGEAGDQTTNECTYTGYTRIPVARDGTGWVVTDNSVSPAADVTFPLATLGTETATHASVGVVVAGASMILHSGTLTPNIVIAPGVRPVIKSTSVIQED